MKVSLVVSVIGVALLVVGAFVAPQHVAVSYLAAYMTMLAVVIGTVLLVAIAELSGAVWFVVFRPRAEAVMSCLPMLALLALPLFLFPGVLWQLGSLSPDTAHSRLQPSYVIAWALVYWAIWLGSSEALLQSSWRADADAITTRRRRQIISAIAVPLVSMTLSLASFDWMMSLSPDWSSTVYGAYYSTGGLLAALALLAAMPFRERPGEELLTPTAEHLHAMGRLTLAFLLLWGYLWYAQFFIIWIADIPREVTWYVVRLQGGWRILARTLIITGFVVPVLTLFVRVAKRSSLVMGLLGWLLLVVHYLDVYWTVVPTVRPQWTFAHLVWDLASLAAIVGLSSVLAIWRYEGIDRVPVGPSVLRESLQYEAH